MPKNAITKTTDGRRKYMFTDKIGNRHNVWGHKNETLADFKRRCENLERGPAKISTMTFAELFKLWQKEFQELNCSPSDVHNLQEVFKYTKAIHYYKLDSVKRADVYAVLAAAKRKGLSTSTLSKIRGCISRPYNWAINTLGLDLDCPTTGLIMKSKNESKDHPTGGLRVLSSEEASVFFSCAKRNKYYNYFLLLQYTGLRPSEAAGLKVKDDKGNVLEIRRAITNYGLSDLKTRNARRDIPISSRLRSVIENQRSLIEKISYNTNGWLFPSAVGAPNLVAIQSAFKRIRLAAGKQTFTIYNFRHTFATNMSRKLTPTQLQYIMGHANIEITLKYYIGLTDLDKSSAAGLMDEVFGE